MIDAHPATLGRLGGVRGHIVASLGVEHFGQSGTETDLYRRCDLDRGSIAATAQMVPRARLRGWQPSVVSMSATRAQELISDGPDGRPGYAMPCLCDEFLGEVAAFRFACRTRVLVEPDFNVSRNPGFAYGPSEI